MQKIEKYFRSGLTKVQFYQCKERAQKVSILSRANIGEIVSAQSSKKLKFAKICLKISLLSFYSSKNREIYERPKKGFKKLRNEL